MTKSELAELISRADPYGALHIVVDDGNCEDSHLDFCRRQPDLLPFESQILDALAKIPIDEREDVLGFGEKDYGGHDMTNDLD